MNNKKLSSRVIAAAVAVLLVFCTAAASYCFAAPGTSSIEIGKNGVLYIKTAEDFAAFARFCRYDANSRGLSVELSADIKLDGSSFEPVPIFCGSFDGKGYTVTGYDYTDEGSTVGLFRIVAQGAVVKNLRFEGGIRPEGTAEYVGGIAGKNFGTLLNCTFVGSVSGKEQIGGIAGKNDTTGLISACRTYGVAKGEHYTGGITGYNSGIVINSENSMLVNVTDEEIQFSLQNIDLSNIISAEGVTGSTDTGGIAGFSSGSIRSCTNLGNVGYIHLGYNVGGIAGRQSGYINNCRNSGEINGRKDVGGIVGQAEPFRAIDFSADIAAKLSEQADKLDASSDRLTETADSSNDKISGTIDSLADSLDNVRSDLSDLSDYLSGYADDISDSANELSARVTDTLDKMAPILDNFTEITRKATDLTESLRTATDELAKASDLASDSVESLNTALDKMDGVSAKLSDALADLGDSLEMLKDAMGDADEIEKAAKDTADSLKTISDGLSELSDAVTSFGDAADILDERVTDSKEWNALFDNAEKIGDSISELSEAVGDIASAVDKLKDSVDEKKTKAVLEDILSATEHFDNASKKLDEALAEISGNIGGDSSSAKDAVFEIKKCKSDFDTAQKQLDEARQHLENSSEGQEALKYVASAEEHIAKAAEYAGLALDAASSGDLTNAATYVANARAEAKAADADLTSARKILDSLGSSDDEEVKAALASFTAAQNSLRSAQNHAKNAFDSAGDFIDSVDVSLGGIVKALGTITEAGKEFRLGLGSVRDAIENADGAVDKDKADKAYNNLQDSVERLSDAGVDLGDAMSDAISILDDMRDSESANEIKDLLKSAKDSLGTSLDKFSEATDVLSSALDTITGEIDGNKIGDAVGLLSDATRLLSSVADSVDKASDDLKDSMKALDLAAQSLTDAFGTLGDSMDIMKEISGIATTASDDLHTLVRDLADKEEIKMPSLGEKFTSLKNNLSDSSKSALDIIKRLNSELSDSADELIDCLSDVGDIVSEVLHIFSDAISGEDGRATSIDELTEDISDEDTDEVTQGKVSGSTNAGLIKGDVNVGGIAGSMAIEFDFDPEDDVTKIGEESFNFRYRTRSVLRECTNTGEINAKKNYVGGIVGREDLGSVIDCINDSAVSSDSGSYCGGIAGASYSTIRGSWSRSAVSSATYCGGIAGYGYTLIGNGAIVKFDDSDIDIEEFYGAICGDADGDGAMKDNFYVKGNYGGVDGVGYEGKAEPCTFDVLSAKESFPAFFLSYEVKFTEDDEVISSVTKKYGESIDDDEIPEIPFVEGTYAHWSSFDKNSVTFPETVTVERNSYVTSLSAGDAGTPAVAVVDGLFTDRDSLEYKYRDGDNMPVDNAEYTIELRLDGTSKSADGLTTLRLKLPDGKKQRLYKYSGLTGEKTKLDYTVNGSYAVVEGESLANSAVYYFEKGFSPVSATVLIVVIILAAAVLAAAIFGKAKAGKRGKYSAKPKG